MFGGFMFTPVVRALLTINMAVFIISQFIFDLTPIFGLRYVLSQQFHLFQFVTYMFLHADFGHVFFNMFALFVFGPMLENHWGSKKFLMFYLVTGIGAGLIYSAISFYQMYDLQMAINQYAANPNPDSFTVFMNKYANSTYLKNYGFINGYAADPTNTEYIKQSIEFANHLFARKAYAPLIGASGAVFGILMAFGMSFPQAELFILFIPFPIKAWVYVTVYGIIELYSGVRAAENDNVAHFAHIGGMIFAFVLIRLWRKKNTYNDYY